MAMRLTEGRLWEYLRLNSTVCGHPAAAADDEISPVADLFAKDQAKSP